MQQVKFEKSPGQLAYERDLIAKANYPDGARRRDWDELCDVAKDSWERNPTARKPPQNVPDAVKTAFDHVKSLYPEVTRVAYDEDLRWHYMDSSGNLPDFDGAVGGVDVSLLEDAADRLKVFPVTFVLNEAGSLEVATDGRNKQGTSALNKYVEVEVPSWFDDGEHTLLDAIEAGAAVSKSYTVAQRHSEIPVEIQRQKTVVADLVGIFLRADKEGRLWQALYQEGITDAYDVALAEAVKLLGDDGIASVARRYELDAQVIREKAK